MPTEKYLPGCSWQATPHYFAERVSPIVASKSHLEPMFNGNRLGVKKGSSVSSLQQKPQSRAKLLASHLSKRVAE